jgi:CubicO group peptidase (beta-lactamase class C family)
LCIWVLIDRGRLKYNQRIVEFWPEFGKNGKKDITVECILTHRAGLPIFDSKITLDIARDPEKIARIIEKQAPLWDPSIIIN